MKKLTILFAFVGLTTLVNAQTSDLNGWNFSSCAVRISAHIMDYTPDANGNPICVTSNTGWFVFGPNSAIGFPTLTNPNLRYIAAGLMEVNGTWTAEVGEPTLAGPCSTAFSFPANYTAASTNCGTLEANYAGSTLNVQ